MQLERLGLQSPATYGCSLHHIRLQVLRVAIDGPYLRARESVGLIFGGMLRKLASFGNSDADPNPDPNPNP